MRLQLKKACFSLGEWFLCIYRDYILMMQLPGVNCIELGEI